VFVGTVVMQLVQEGTLSLEGTVNTYLPGSALINADSMTVRQLLDHTAGTYDFEYDPDYLGTQAKNPRTPWTPQQLLDLVLRHEPKFSPGARWGYSNSNYLLLGMIVEKVTGDTLGNQIRKRIVDRMGLKSTYFAEGLEWNGEHMSGYMRENMVGPLIDVTIRSASSSWAAGAMVSTVGDLRKFIIATAAGETLDAATQKARMTCVDTGAVYGNLKNMYCLGIEMLGEIVGHSGDTIGFQSSAWTWPSKGITITIGQNKNLILEGTATQMSRELFNVLVPGYAE
ncbi:MAG: serine hydrolase domain-containing protein, partial [Myxococcota bacterium]|jgi:D-alanyl-D-alanine carboxypeptidase